MHRPLIRASLPRDRRRSRRRRAPIPEFTIRQPGGRPQPVPARAISAAARRRRPAVPGQPVERRRQRARRPARRRHALERRPAAAGPRRRRRRAATGPAAGSGRSSAPASSLTRPQHMPDLSGKHGLIVGVANKRSISWAIAQAAAAAGARLALTYPSERLEENVRELAATLDNPLVLPCDVADDQQIADLGGDARSRVRRPRLPRARRRVRAGRRAEESVRRDVARELPHRARRQRLLAHRLDARASSPLMEKRGGGSILTLTFIGSERVFTNYNVMGVAKAALESSVRYLAADLGPKNIRVNAISAGAIKTLAAAGISGFSTHPAGLSRDARRCAAASSSAEVADAARFPAQPGGARHHRRNPDGRRRLPRHGRSLGLQNSEFGLLDLPFLRSLIR